MPDYLFFPFVAVALAAMTWAAIAPGPERRREALEALGDPQEGLIVQGDNLASFQIPEGLSLDLVALEDGRTAASLTAFKAYDAPPQSAGIFIALPPEFQAVFSGERVRLSVQAQRPAANGSPHFFAGYFPGGRAGGGAMGWRDSEIDQQLETYSFEFDVPPPDGGAGQDYVGVWPDPEGLGRSIDLVRLTVEILDADAPGA